MTKNKKILIIIQRSNGDVFLSSSLIKSLYENYESPQIDLLVNDDTYSIAKIIPHIKNIFSFSYKEKRNNRWSQEKNIIFSIFKKYDLSINLTASDRSVLYALFAGKKAISAVEKDSFKSWWKKLLLTHYYYFDSSKHILINNLKPLDYLNINFQNIHHPIEASAEATLNIKKKLKLKSINKFLIFHPSAQYNYKIYPKSLRDKLLFYLSKLEIPIILTGGNNPIDLELKKQMPSLPFVFDFIGDTSIEEFFALSKLSLGYIGMDTLNMHIAASQNKRIFAIFGSTKLSMWAPWSNELMSSSSINKPLQTYGKNTIFQSSLPCKVCDKVGCGNNHGLKEFPYDIEPEKIFNEIKNWYLSLKDFV